LPPSSSVEVGVLGDVMLGHGVADALGRQPREALWSAEAPETLLRGKSCFFWVPQARSTSRALYARAVGLTNNHALDYGEYGLHDTLELLHAAGASRSSAASWREPPMWMSESCAIRIATRCPTAPPG
jgi:hypothetical protein